jgi:hypothetical protein
MRLDFVVAKAPAEFDEKFLGRAGRRGAQGGGAFNRPTMPHGEISPNLR